MGELSQISHIPPDLVVKYQCIDIASVILWLVCRPPGMRQWELKERAVLTR
jgi:hypothetical protein